MKLTFSAGLAVIALIVAIGLHFKQEMQPMIILYWIVLTMKNGLDITEVVKNKNEL